MLGWAGDEGKGLVLPWRPPPSDGEGVGAGHCPHSQVRRARSDGSDTFLRSDDILNTSWVDGGRMDSHAHTHTHMRAGAGDKPHETKQLCRCNFLKC